MGPVKRLCRRFRPGSFRTTSRTSQSTETSLILKSGTGDPKKKRPISNYWIASIITKLTSCCSELSSLYEIVLSDFQSFCWNGLHQIALRQLLYSFVRMIYIISYVNEPVSGSFLFRSRCRASVEDYPERDRWRLATPLCRTQSILSHRSPNLAFSYYTVYKQRRGGISFCRN